MEMKKNRCGSNTYIQQNDFKMKAIKVVTQGWSLLNTKGIDSI